MCIIIMEPMRCGSKSFSSSNPLRIPCPKIDKLACQAQGMGIFAKGEITLRDAYCTFNSCRTTCGPNMLPYFRRFVNRI